MFITTIWSKFTPYFNFTLISIFLCGKSLQAAYISKDDNLLHISSVYIQPFTDNMNQIYASKAEELIKNQIQQEHQWDLTDEQKKADLIITSRLTKNPKSMTIKLQFIVNKKTDLNFYDSVDLPDVFETHKVLIQYQALFNNLKKKVPYSGIVLSRNNEQLTLNIGKTHGLKEGSEILAILITKIKSHPKTFQYISAEKEVLGKILITKADDYLSFGKILYERELNSIQKLTKLEFSKLDIKLATDTKGLQNRTDSPVVIGETPQEWVPTEDPQYGRLSVLGGLIQYNQNLSFLSAGAKTVGQWFSPTIKAQGELWLNQDFHLEIFIRQTSLKLTNPLDGSTPGSINSSLSQYQIKAKYNYQLQSGIRSPTFQVAFGLGQFQASVDTSAPVTLSSHSFGGMLVGFNGQFPISDEIPVDLGLFFNYFISKSLSDSASANSSGVQINDFGLSVKYLKSKRLSYVFELGFEYYAADFDALSGQRSDPINSASHKMTSTLAGIEYSF